MWKKGTRKHNSEPYVLDMFPSRALSDALELKYAGLVVDGYAIEMLPFENGLPFFAHSCVPSQVFGRQVAERVQACNGLEPRGPRSGA